MITRSDLPCVQVSQCLERKKDRNSRCVEFYIIEAKFNEYLITFRTYVPW